ncbi:MvdC/MvdD family ATP grasp protein [Amycolatopsis magusensis]|uniref:MvdC/MvdD family ATP grasp protein n=1 Tax=Amycolatopsis magusensis TaxID=882444 RepID=UPI00379D96E0
MTVLILARDFDPTVDAVIGHLTDAGVPVFRTDLRDFPTRLKLAARLDHGRWRGRLWNEQHEVDLADIRSIWRRNPSTYHLPESMSESVQEVAFREAKLGLGGILAALDVLWVNHPNRCADAIYKPYQWTVARECGLNVADTVITNDADTAAAAIDQWPGTITKLLGPGGFTDDEGQPRSAPTRPITPEDRRDLAGVASTATTLQEQLGKKFEVRLTVIGDSWFPVAIHAHSPAARIDWRTDPGSLSYAAVEVPADVTEGVQRYLDRTGLVLAGIDFVVRPDGRWVFLEANTGPQFGWLAASTGAAMIETLAEVLAKGRR